MSEFPLRHLSIRVPWHDAGWKGVVCDCPQFNGSCSKLKRIAESKKDSAELAWAAKTLDEIPSDEWPPCVHERATFMAPFEINIKKAHPLANSDGKNFGHLKPTTQHYSPYSAGVVPFLWMMRENIPVYGKRLEIEIDQSREPELGYSATWVNDFQNQKALLESFAGHLRLEESLCFFYAKHVPFVEGTGRILIGVGRINGIGGLTEYEQDGNGRRGFIWERPMQHSIRPNGRDGFLMPYQDLLKRAEEAPSLDLERYSAFVAEEDWEQFSYGSELVTHDAAIASLLSMERALRRAQEELGVSTESQRKWLHDELVRIWKVRGPFPGLGAVLTAIGLSQGLFVAQALQEMVGENTDPWPKVEEFFADPTLLSEKLRRDAKELSTTWFSLPEERRRFLRLLSRFEINLEQAKNLYDKETRGKKGWDSTDQELLENPYRIFEISRNSLDGIRLMTVDRGVFPEDSVRLQFPLEKPSQLDSGVDIRRIRAFTIEILEQEASRGHTLQFSNEVVEKIRDLPLQPNCQVTSDNLVANGPAMAPEVTVDHTDLKHFLQLSRYSRIGELIRKQVLGRIKGARHSSTKNWFHLLEEKFGHTTEALEEKAREEKAKALTELAEARFSVLIGPAGTGKTSLLGILCGQQEILQEGLLLLAPTGKARVRMQELAGVMGSKALTIAQFLNQCGRYDTENGRYLLNTEKPKVTCYGTVIVDEASMLTEDMLGALFDALQGVKRFILVGDPAQLPPIGAGRPFVDIVNKLRPENLENIFPKVAPGYAELTIERRQMGLVRPDIRLARWFSLTPPSVGDDEIFSGKAEHDCLRFVAWDKPEDLQEKLLKIIEEELQLEDGNDIRSFNRALGANACGDYDYFNRTIGSNLGAVKAVDSWQILSPLRGMPFGVGDVNRLIHKRFRARFIELATRHWGRLIPKPKGAEQVVYGDKVINLINQRKIGYPQDGALSYLANGEIGIVVGQWKQKGSNQSPYILHVEFSSQPGFTYSFFDADFSEESGCKLELAYALTVHKAQGSQFKLVIFVLPANHPILSRELIYTALTRHQNRVVILHQGPKENLKHLSAPQFSEIARRQTNLLSECRMLEFPQIKGSIFLQDGLIHRASNGLAVRSKSELLIAEALISSGIGFEYEKPLTLGGVTRYPDFTIEDDISGLRIYWEHLGMLEKEEYRKGWERKLSWYQGNGVLPIKESKDASSLLITTTESSTQGLDMALINRIIKDHLT